MPHYHYDARKESQVKNLLYFCKVSVSRKKKR